MFLKKKHYRHLEKRKSLLTFVLGLGIGGFASLAWCHTNNIGPYNRRPLPSYHMDIYFSPRGGAADALINSIHNAKKSIFIQIYIFSYKPIYEALRIAHQRGVAIQVIMDKSQSDKSYSMKRHLIKAGIPVWIDHTSGLMHLKTTIIDEEIVFTGSYNYTAAAEKSNVEILEKHRNAAYAKDRIAHWRERQKLSKRCPSSTRSIAK